MCGRAGLTEELHIKTSGEINLETGQALFEDVKKRLIGGGGALVLDLQDVRKIDSLGGTWILRIKHYAVSLGARFECRGATGLVSEYLRMIAPGIEYMDREPPRNPGFFETIGDTYYKVKQEYKEARNLIIDVLYWTFMAPFGKKGLRWQSVMDELHEMGVRAIGIVVLINYLLGFIVSMLAAAQVRNWGAGIYVADMVAIGFARELAPIMTAVIVSARSGAAIAAEMATMEVQEEIDALRGMGFNVSYFLIAPKVVAMVLAMPCLVMIAMAAGVWGGLHVAIFILGLDSGMWIRESILALQIGDMVQGLLKSIVFAIIIVLVGCHNGMRVTGGARGVGLVTTRSVVMDIFFIVTSDVIFATLFYYTF